MPGSNHSVASDSGADTGAGLGLAARCRLASGSPACPASASSLRPGAAPPSVWAAQRATAAATASLPPPAGASAWAGVAAASAGPASGAAALAPGPGAPGAPAALGGWLGGAGGGAGCSDAAPSRGSWSGAARAPLGASAAAAAAAAASWLCRDLVPERALASRNLCGRRELRPAGAGGSKGAHCSHARAKVCKLRQCHGATAPFLHAVAGFRTGRQQALDHGGVQNDQRLARLLASAGAECDAGSRARPSDGHTVEPGLTDIGDACAAPSTFSGPSTLPHVAGAEMG